MAGPGEAVSPLNPIRMVAASTWADGCSSSSTSSTSTTATKRGCLHIHIKLKWNNRGLPHQPPGLGQVGREGEGGRCGSVRHQIMLIAPGGGAVGVGERGVGGRRTPGTNT